MLVMLVFNFSYWDIMVTSLIIKKKLIKNYKNSANHFITNYFLDLNQINSTISCLAFSHKIISTSFFFFRFVSKKIHNHSVFSHYSYFPKVGNNYDNNLFIYHNSYSFILFNKDFYYWMNNYLACERYNPYSLKNNFLTMDHMKYLNI